MISLDYSSIHLELKKEHNNTYVFDIIRKKWMVLTPEEHVRQFTIHHFINIMKYPAGLISVEKKIIVGTAIKRFDIIVYGRDHAPWMLIECKKPEIPITKETLYQLLNYQRIMKCSYWLLTNGHQAFCADACDIENITWLNTLPAYDF